MDALVRPTPLLIWIRAARPKTLCASLAPVLLGLAIAGRDVQVDWSLAGLTLLSAVTLQIGTNFINDLMDYLNGADTAARVGPLRVMQAGLLTVRQMQFGIVLIFGICIGTGLILVRQSGGVILMIGTLGVLMGILYTLGSSLLSLYGLSDLMVIAFFGTLAVGGTAYIQTGVLSSPAFVAGVAPGLLSTAILTVNNIRDIEQDTRAGRRTWVVRFGTDFGRWEYLLCLGGAALIPWILVYMEETGQLALTASATLILGIPLIRQVWKWQGPALNRTLGLTAGLLLLHSATFSLGWLV